jgi:hypothetical protein
MPTLLIVQFPNWKIQQQKKINKLLPNNPIERKIPHYKNYPDQKQI